MFFGCFLSFWEIVVCADGFGGDFDSRHGGGYLIRMRAFARRAWTLGIAFLEGGSDKKVGSEDCEWERTSFLLLHWWQAWK